MVGSAAVETSMTTRSGGAALEPRPRRNHGRWQSLVDRALAPLFAMTGLHSGGPANLGIDGSYVVPDLRAGHLRLREVWYVDAEAGEVRLYEAAAGSRLARSQVVPGADIPGIVFGPAGS